MSFYKLPAGKTMSLNRIKAIITQEFFISIRSIEVINDLFFFPIFSNVIIFGFLVNYLSKNINDFNPATVFIGIILWQPVYIVSYSIAVGSLWNIWSRNLTNMFIAPITVGEYLIAYGFSGVLKGIVLFALSYFISLTIFHINLSSIGFLTFLVFFINVCLSGFSLGVFLLGLIFRYGTKISAVAWGLVFIIQPLMAVVYPVSILPSFIRPIAYFFPPTYIFEAARDVIKGPSNIFPFIVKAFIINIICLYLSVIFFKFMFKKSKETGQFSKLEV